MFLGRVIGTLVATIKIDNLQGTKFLIVQPLDENMKENGNPLVAIDHFQAGTGELVFLEDGKESSYTLPNNNFAAVDAGVVGIVDEVNSPETGFYHKNS